MSQAIGSCGLVVLALLAVGGNGLHGQQAPTFRASAELLTLSVVVVDRDGRPVGDLAPTDFKVTVAGKPATVRVADFVNVSGRAPSPNSPGDESARVIARADRRSVMLLFDDLSLTSEEALDVRRTLPRLLDQFDAGDLVGFVATSGLGPVVVPSELREPVLDALRTVDGRDTGSLGPMVIGIDEALEIDRRAPLQTLGRVIKRECAQVGLGPGCEDLVEAQAKHQAADARRRFIGQTDALRRAVSVMGQLGAPRVVVLLSKGVADQAEPERRAEVFEEIETLAALSGVQLYGLALTGDDSDVRDSSHERAQVRRLSNRTYFTGLQAMAAAAGGDAFAVIGQPDRFFERIALETSGFYRLGVEPHQPLGGATTVETRVVVGRRELTVRSVGRTSTIAGPTAVKPRTAADAFRSGVSADELPLVVGSAIRKMTAESVEVVTGIQVTSHTAPVQVVFGLFDERQELVTGGQRTIPAASQQARSLLFPLQVPHGTYRLRVAAMDAAGRVALTEQPVSSLGDSDGVQWSDLFVQGNVDGQFPLVLTGVPPNVPIQATLEVYGSPEVLARTVVHFSIDQPGEPSSLVLSGPTALRAFERGGMATVALPPLTSGEPARTLRATIFVDGREVGHVLRQLRLSTRRP